MSRPDRFARTLIALAATPGVVTDEALRYLKGVTASAEMTRVRRLAQECGAPGEIVRVGGFGYRMSLDMRTWFAERRSA